MNLLTACGNTGAHLTSTSSAITNPLLPSHQPETVPAETDNLLSGSMLHLNSTVIELTNDSVKLVGNLNPGQQKIVQSVQDYVDGKRDDICISNESFSAKNHQVNSTATVSLGERVEMHQEESELVSSADGFCNRLTRIAALIRFVTNNEAQSTPGRYACNAANTLTRHAISVFLPTLIRQMLGYAIENGLGQNHYAMRMAVGTLCAAYPILINVAALAVEKNSGTDENSKTAARITNIIVGTAALCAAVYTETLPEVAASLASFVAYCMMRDVAQMYAKLADGTQEKIPPQVTSASACFYFFNQLLIGSAMQGLAAPSGQSAAGLPYLDVIGHDVLRAFFNWIGESIDNVTLSGLQCRHEGRDLALQLKWHSATLEDFKNTLSGAHSGRTSLFEGMILTASQINLPSIFAGSDTEGIKPALILLSSGIDALLLALGYSLFVRTAGGECAIL